uniref:TDP43_N domain-containing protein n=1 Tax=Wuchereria bancrofti TaxID=6293 RepID=A0A1I8EYJ1_WUCBA
MEMDSTNGLYDLEKWRRACSEHPRLFIISICLCCSLLIPSSSLSLSYHPGSKGIEIPLCPSHGVLHVRTLKNVFKDATGLKYRNPDTGLDRVLLMDHDETCFIAPTGGWKNKMFTVVRSTKFVRPPGNAKKQVKRSLANKSKMMADMDSNSDGKMRPASAPEGAC